MLPPLDPISFDLVDRDFVGFVFYFCRELAIPNSCSRRIECDIRSSFDRNTDDFLYRRILYVRRADLQHLSAGTGPQLKQQREHCNN